MAECERFRREITGDNPAQDGAARQETSSREPAAGRVGEGCRSLTALQPAGQPQGVGQRAPCLVSPPYSLPFTFQDAFTHSRALDGLERKA